jgi:hypothetical protein
MVNPSLMPQLAQEYRREDLAAREAHGLALRLSHHPIRQRLGWSLMGLGARLTRDPLVGTPLYGRHGRGAPESGARPSGARGARTSVPLARL